MTMFDDLIPGNQATSEGGQDSGLFDDLIPKPSGLDQFAARYVTNPIMRGKNQSLDPVIDVTGLMTGTKTPEQFAEGIVKNQQEAAQYPQDPRDAAAMQEFQKAQGFWQSLGVLLQNPAIALQVGMESAPASLAVGAGGMAGAVGGQAAIPIPGVGAGIGLATGTGLASAYVDFTNSFVQALTDTGQPLTKESVLAAVNDPVIMARAKDYAIKHGMAVGAFDAISAGIAGRIAKPIEKLAGTGAPGRVAGAAGEVGAQAALGAGGEASGQIAATGKVNDWKDVALEGVGEVVTGPLEIGQALASREAAAKVTGQQPPQSTVPPQSSSGPATGQVPPQGQRVEPQLFPGAPTPQEEPAASRPVADSQQNRSSPVPTLEEMLVQAGMTPGDVASMSRDVARNTVRDLVEQGALPTSSLQDVENWPVSRGTVPQPGTAPRVSRQQGSISADPTGAANGLTEVSAAPVAEENRPPSRPLQQGETAPGAPQVEGQGQAQPVAPPLPTITPQQINDLKSFLDGKKKITPENIAAELGVDLPIANRLIQEGIKGGGIMQTRSGGLRRPPVRVKPDNAVEFIASVGGMRDERGELQARDARRLMTPYGPLARPNGKTEDQIRELLVENGYLTDSGRDTGGQATTTVEDVYRLIDQHLAGKPVYAIQDQEQGQAIDDAKRAKAEQNMMEAAGEELAPTPELLRARARTDTIQQVKAAADEMGIRDFFGHELEQIAQDVEAGTDIYQAIENAIVHSEDIYEQDFLQQFVDVQSGEYAKRYWRAQQQPANVPFPETAPRATQEPEQPNEISRPVAEAGGILPQDRQEYPERGSAGANLEGSQEAGGTGAVQGEAAERGAGPASARIQPQDADEAFTVKLTAKGPWDFNDTFPIPDLKLIQSLENEGRNPFQGDETHLWTVEEVVYTVQESLNEMLSAQAEAVDLYREAKDIETGKVKFKPKKDLTQAQHLKNLRDGAARARQQVLDIAAVYTDIMGEDAGKAMVSYVGKQIRTEQPTASSPKKPKPQQAKEQAAPAPELDDTAGSEALDAVGGPMPAAEVFPAPDKIHRPPDEAYIPLSEAKKRVASWKKQAMAQGNTGENAKRVILSLFDYTGTWSQPYYDAGFTVLQYDIRHSASQPGYEAGDEKYSDILSRFPMSDILEIRRAGYEIYGVLSACPCTTYAASGARWWKDLHDAKSADAIRKVWGDWVDAEAFESPLEVNQMLTAATQAIVEFARPTGFHVMENPVGRIAEMNELPDPLLRFNPNNYGDPYTKKTQLWGSFSPDLPTANVEPTEGSKMHKLRGDNPEQKNARSTTPEGFSYAFFMANNPRVRPGKVIEGAPTFDPNAELDVSADVVRQREPDAAPAPTTETGADGKEQTVLPGAEAVSEEDARKAEARRRAQAELEARKKQSMVRRGGQEGVDTQTGGLFEEKSGDLFAAPAKAEAKKEGTAEKTYTYAAKYRPPGYATVPEGFTEIGKASAEHPFGTVTYAKPLTFQQEKDFELEPLDPNHPTNRSKRRDAFVEEFRRNFERQNERARFKGREGAEAIIGPSTVKDVDWQLTFFSNGVPTGHLDFNDFDQMASEVWGLTAMGYTETPIKPAEQPAPVKEPKAEPEKPALTLKQQDENSAAKIEDFGEKIHGARKDAVRDIVKSLEDDVDIASEPLSKTFPQPDYVKMAEAGVDKKALALVALFRNEIPTKPQKKYKLARWVEQVKTLREFSRKLLSGVHTVEEIVAKLQQSSLLTRLADMAEVIKAIDPQHLPFAAKWSVHHSRVTFMNGKRIDPPKSFYILHDDNQRWTDINEEKLEDFIPKARALIEAKIAKLAQQNNGKTAAPRRTPINGYQDRFTKEYFIGFKGLTGVIRLKTGFTSGREVRNYMLEHADELQAQIDKMREEPDLRRASNMPRQGPKRRDGDVSPQMFSEAFAFRGVQFGNYVEDDRRQSDLNEAFDALMDLADVLGIPSKALSLNGQLGLAFGARGHGGKNAAAAHYESDQVVINLTKHAGPGSLAHEWLHALDNYFHKQDTGSDRPVRAYASEALSSKGGMREPMFKAWQAVKKSLSIGSFAKRSEELDQAKSKPYYSTLREKAARAFERYIVDRLAEKETNNDYLANINLDGGAYPTDKEMQEQGIRKAYDDLFSTLEVRTDEKTGQASLHAAVASRDTFAAQVMAELAQDDEFFQYPVSRSLNLETIISETDPKIRSLGRFDLNESDEQNDVISKRGFRDEDGHEFFVMEDGDGQVWLDISGYNKGYGGSGIYSAVSNYAHNTGKVFIGDPAGLSDDALRRRTEAMLSSALKFGTTKHLAPHERQIKGSPEQGIPPLKWTEGDDLGNIQSLIDASTASINAAVPELAIARYDFENRTFRNAQGQPLSDEAIDEWRHTDKRIGKARAGRSTVKRSILLNTLLRTAGSARPGLLEQVLRFSHQLVSDGPLKGTLYANPSRKKVVPSQTNPIRFVMSPKQEAEATHALGQLAERILGHQIAKVNVIPDWDVWTEAFGEHTEAEYSPDHNVINIALQGTRNALTNLRHEAIHALRQAAVFTKPEWAMLARMADLRWIEEFNIEQRYAHYREQFDISEEALRDILREEAVAEAFAFYLDSKLKPTDPLVTRLFQKVKEFLEALANYLKGRGFQTTGNVFKKIESGEVKNRTRGAGEGRGYHLTARQQSLQARVMPRSNPNATSSFVETDDSAMSVLMNQNLGMLSRIGGAVANWALPYRRGMQDKMADWARQQQAIEEQTGPIPAAANVYRAETLYHGRTGERLEDLRLDRLLPLIDDIATRGLKLEDVDRYLYARHAPERNAEMAKINPGNPDGLSGMTNAEAQQVMADFQQAGKLTELQAVAAKIDQLKKETNDRLLQNGIIDQATYDAWQGPNATYQHYVPLQGFEQDPDADARVGTGKRYDTRTKVAMQALGRRSKADSPLAYMIAQAQQSIILSEKARVGRAVLRMARRYPNPRLWQVNQVVLKRMIDPATGLVTTRVDGSARTRAENVLAVREGGNLYWVTVHHNGLAAGIKGTESSNVHAVLRYLMSFNRYLALVNTGANPEFFIPNFLRDLSTAGIHISADQGQKVMRGTIKDLRKAFVGSWKGERGNLNSQWAQYYREFAQAGGKVGIVQSNVIADIKAKMDKDLRLAKGGTLAVSQKAVESAIKIVTDVNAAVESAIRLSLYVNMRQAGYSADEAAYAAKEVTVNFNRKGEWGNIINSLFLFFNASVQGTARIALGLKRSKLIRRTAMGLIVSGFLMDMLNAMVAGDDDDDDKNDYDQMPDFVIERNIVVPVSDGTRITIPLPWVYNVFYYAGVNTSRAVRGATEPLEAAANVMGALAQAANPLYASTFGQMVTPTFLDPFMDIGYNRDWKGDPLRPEYNSNVPKPQSQKYWDSVPAFWKEVAQKINAATGGDEARPGLIDISPEDMQYMAEFLTGGAGRLVSNGAQTIWAVINGDNPLPENIPFSRKVISRHSPSYGRSEYYQMREAIGVTEAQMKNAREDRDREKMNQVREQYAADLKAGPIFDAAEKQLRELKKQRNKTSDPDMRRMLDERRDAIMAKARKRYRQLQEANP